MPTFRARIVNLPGYGEVITRHKRGGSTRDKFVLGLDGRTITIKQRKAALAVNGNRWRGKQIDTSTVYVSKVSSLDEGSEIVDDLCWLLSFATHSNVSAYHYSYGKRARGHSVFGVYNHWRPPFHSGWGSISDFVQQAWPRYQTLKSSRPLSAFIHMIEVTDLPDTLLETQISLSIQCLESIKTYFALAEGQRFNINEHRSGKFLDGHGKELHFERLLRLTLEDVGMALPPFKEIKRLRNALIHRGFIRETDKITKYIFGPVPPRGIHSAMFAVMEDVQDILREYMLRLLGYKGRWCAYGQKRDIYRTIS